MPSDLASEVVWSARRTGRVPDLFMLQQDWTDEIARGLNAALRTTVIRRGRQLAAVLAIGAAVTAVALPMQLSDPLNNGFNTSSAVAGLGTALVYVAGFLLLLRTPLGSVLSRVFEPLGRMALTHYVSATLLVLLADQLLALDESRKWGVMFALAAGIAVVQWVFSRLWLRRFRYGPLEWCWRCVTWWRYVPNRRVAA